MNEQKNLYLAIGISIAIIIFFQILFPSQPIPSMYSSRSIEPAANVAPEINANTEKIANKLFMTLSSYIPLFREQFLFSQALYKTA